MDKHELGSNQTPGETSTPGVLLSEKVIQDADQIRIEVDQRLQHPDNSASMLRNNQYFRLDNQFTVMLSGNRKLPEASRLPQDATIAYRPEPSKPNAEQPLLIFTYNEDRTIDNIEYTIDENDPKTKVFVFTKTPDNILIASRAFYDEQGDQATSPSFQFIFPGVFKDFSSLIDRATVDIKDAVRTNGATYFAGSPVEHHQSAKRNESTDPISDEQASTLSDQIEWLLDGNLVNEARYPGSTNEHNVTEMRYPENVIDKRSKRYKYAGAATIADKAVLTATTVEEAILESSDTIRSITTEHDIHDGAAAYTMITHYSVNADTLATSYEERTDASRTHPDLPPKPRTAEQIDLMTQFLISAGLRTLTGSRLETANYTLSLCGVTKDPRRVRYTGNLI